MNEYEYRGFTIHQVTRVDYLVKKDGKAIESMTAGNIPRTLKAAKAHIDSILGAKEEAMLSLETIMKDTVWVAKMTYGRHVGTYEEVEAFSIDEECRDFDICGKQPEHLEAFYEGYFEYCRKNGWTTIPEYYHIIEEGGM